jgi:hypothetical protein
MPPSETPVITSLKDQFVFAGICVVLVVAPLPFGSVHVWAYSLLELAVLALFTIFFIKRITSGTYSSLQWIKTPANLFILLFIFLVLFQLIPLPSGVVAYLSPQTYTDKIQAASILKETSLAVDFPPGFMSLAYTTHPVLRELIKILSYVMIFFLVLNTAESRRRIDILIYLLVLMGLFEAVYGAFQFVSDRPGVLWWHRGSRQFASGTFIVSNHLAFYLEMIFPLSVGYLIGQRNQHKRMTSGLGGTRSKVQRLVNWFSPESANPRRLFLFFVSLMLGIGFLMTASRGGIISLGVAMLVMSVLFFTKKKYKMFGWFALCVCLVTFISGLYVGIDRTLDKFGYAGETFSNRMAVSKSAIPMLLDYPLVGVGLGNFRDAYSPYTPAEGDGVHGTGHAHNDWVEAGTETGIVGLVLVAAGFFWFVFKLVKIWRLRRHPYAVGIGAGVMTGLLSVASHSIIDFNMHIPANPMTLGAFMAIGFAAVHRQERGFFDAFFYKTRTVRLRAPMVVMSIICLLILSAMTSYRISTHFLAEMHCPTEWNSTLTLDWHPERESIIRAIGYNPGNAEYYLQLAMNYLHSSDEKFQEKSADDKAIENFLNAVQLNPLRTMGWFNLGALYLKQTSDPFTFVTRWTPLAGKCFDMAIKLDPVDAANLFDVASYWVWRSTLINPDNGDTQKFANNMPNLNESQAIRESGRSKAVEEYQSLFRRALSIKPDKWKQSAEIVWSYYPDPKTVLQIVPKGHPEIKTSMLKWLVTHKDNDS